MDKIWDRKSFEVGSHWRCGGDEKTNDHAEMTKLERYFFLVSLTSKKTTIFESFI